ncbi:potassium voltage-gated channel subfamily H member 7 [Trichonephila clavipes]|nr:potassium voltage-gated channel subfamily H member 7 [Trichonephila clavipes]
MSDAVLRLFLLAVTAKYIPVLIRRCNSGATCAVTSTPITIILESLPKPGDDTLGDSKFLGYFQLGVAESVTNLTSAIFGGSATSKPPISVPSLTTNPRRTSAQDVRVDIWTRPVTLTRSSTSLKHFKERPHLLGPGDQDGDRFNSCQVIYSQFGLAIHQNHHQARRRFVEWAQNEMAVVPDFHKRILFSDEAHFWLNVYVNKQNGRIWSEANPQVYVETPLHPEKLTSWCALWAGGILLQKR